MKTISGLSIGQAFLDNFFTSFDEAIREHLGTVQLHLNELAHLRKFGRGYDQMSISADGRAMFWRRRELLYGQTLKKGEIRIGLAFPGGGVRTTEEHRLRANGRNRTGHSSTVLPGVGRGL